MSDKSSVLILYGNNALVFDQSIGYRDECFLELFGYSQYVSMSLKTKIQNSNIDFNLRISLTRLTVFIDEVNQLLNCYNDSHSIDLLNEYENFWMKLHPNKRGIIEVCINCNIKEEQCKTQIDIDGYTDIYSLTNFIKSLKVQLNSLTQ